MDQLSVFDQLTDRSCEFASLVYLYFVNLENTYDQRSLCGVLNFAGIAAARYSFPECWKLELLYVHANFWQEVRRVDKGVTSPMCDLHGGNIKTQQNVLFGDIKCSQHWSIMLWLA